MKLIKSSFLVIVLTASLFPQTNNITNTLGTSGVFTIKDAGTTFFTLSQSTGYLSLNRSIVLLHTSSAITGVIFKGADRFIHNAGINNTFIGVNSGNFTFGGSRSTALGVSSLLSNTTGSDNTAVGVSSLLSNTTGSDNTAVGNSSLYSNTTGFQNTALGYSSLQSNTIGIQNTALGNQSMFGNTTGDSNTALGYRTGSSINTGSNLTCIGFNAQPTSGTANNQITLGNSKVTSLRCNVITITSLSDMRDKKNIGELSLGIDFLMKLKPRIYNWDKREWYDNDISDGTMMQKAPTAGFIAQELDEAQTTAGVEWLNLVLKDNPEKLEATPGNLLPIMVKAIQELKAENDELKIKLAKFEELQNVLAVEIEKLKAKDSNIKDAKFGEK